ncbi:MAG: potassium transporter [Gammaproteobacteria bacterium]|jgi:trk system potassium uptake protein|nr:potassium transporter [Gammaproteobacteria bacterium]
MQFAVIQRVLGLLLALFSITLLPPILIAWWTNDGAIFAFSMALLITITFGLALWLPVRKVKKELRLRDGFIVVVLFWAGLGLTGAIPLVLSDNPHMSFTDAAFESLSALTTTGATVITGIDSLPMSILFYRQELQWLGGMGIIVLAVAILPLLGIGGMQLYRAESPGPIKDSKLTPRITETAKALWYIYLSLTVSCALAYWLAGMTFFDAVSHSFSTVSIGGFSTHDLSIGYFDNKIIDAIAVFFMVLAGINFTLHFLAWRNMNLKPYFFDTELKAYLSVLIAICIICCSYLIYQDVYKDPVTAITHGIFQTVSIATTTGFTTATYQSWPNFLPVLLLFASFLGACAGSTGGGLKVIRIVLLFKQGMREIRRLVHPNAIIHIKLGDRPVDESIINAVWGFFASYVAVFAIMMLILMATGLDQVTAFSAMAACMNNLGPGLGDVSAHYGDINNVAKWILCIAMLLGRLEIFTLLVLLTPTFWRR